VNAITHLKPTEANSHHTFITGSCKLSHRQNWILSLK